MRGYLPLVQKDSVSHIHGLIVYVKVGITLAWDLSLENSADSYLCFNGFTYGFTSLNALLLFSL